MTTPLPRIFVYTVCWNERVLLPHFFRHYAFAEKIIVYDNGSTDGSRELIAAEPRAELRHWETGGEMRDDALIELKNKMWQEARGQADWIIVCDIDEFLHHPDLPAFFARLADEEATLAQAVGYHIVRERAPAPDDDLLAEIPRGVRDDGGSGFYDKVLLFDPNEIAEINYFYGAHQCRPSGNVRAVTDEPALRLLHFKYLGLDYLLARHQAIQQRYSQWNRERKLSWQYTRTVEEVAAQFQQLWEQALPLWGEAAPSLSRISFVTAVNNEAQYARTRGQLEKLGATDFLPQRNADSIFAAYDAGWRAAKHELIAFIHQDVDLLGVDVHLLAEKLAHSRSGVIGVAGTRRLSEQGVWWEQPPGEQTDLSGRCGHISNGKRSVTEYGPFGEVVVLDGVLLFTTRRLLEALGGWADPPLDGFDFYDLSLTLRAHLAGYRNQTLPIALYHWSPGEPRQSWHTARDQFLRKYGSHLPISLSETEVPQPAPRTPAERQALRQIERLNQAALEAYQNGRYAEAISRYEQVLQQAPSHAPTLTNLASALKRAGRSAEALVRYQQALRLDPGRAEVWFNIANLYQAQGDLPQAEQAFREALKRNGRFIPALFNLANLLRDAQRLEEAEPLYRQVLQLQPEFVRGLTNLANLLRNQGRAQEAHQLHTDARRLEPQNPQILYNMANTLLDLGETEAADEAFAAALKLDSKFAAAWLNWGNRYRQAGELETAEARYREGLTHLPHQPQLLEGLISLLKGRKAYGEALAEAERAVGQLPQNARLWQLLAESAYGLEELARARDAYRQLLRLQPQHAEGLNGLGVVYQALGETAKAAVCWRQALEADPRYVIPLVNLGALARLQREHGRALAYFRQALAIDPHERTAQSHLAYTLIEVGQIEAGLGIAERWLEQDPEAAAAHLLLGFGYAQQGRIEEGLAAMLRSQALEPDAPLLISNILFASQYSDRLTPAEISARHRELAPQIQPLGERATVWPNGRDPERPLRLGYLSPDFRSHPVGFFIEPILREHDRTQFEIFCYSLNPAVDEVTARLQQLADRWFDATTVSDEELLARIRADKIDILIDLAGHTAQNRARIVATKPAPLQAAYIGYVCTTGLPSVDYLIGDGHVAPPELDSLFSEKLLRLPHTFLCFQPQPETPEVAELPALATGQITFGSFNNTPKLSDSCLELWCRVLERVPESRLALKSLALQDAASRERLWSRFEGLGLARERVLLWGPTTPLSAFLAAYGQIDIGLDTTPFNGGTTTCDALWMGVPVVSLAGGHYFSRMGLSLLTAVGHPEWVARSAGEFVEIAAELASDVPHLAALRRGLRKKMAVSPLLDAVGTTRGLEAELRAAWRRYAETG